MEHVMSDAKDGNVIKGLLWAVDIMSLCLLCIY